MEHRYYYALMENRLKQEYIQLYRGIQKRKGQIIMCDPGLTMEELGELIGAITNDNPAFYYLNQSTMDYAMDENGQLILKPQYYFPEEKIHRYNRIMEKNISQLVKKLELKKVPDEEKIRRIHGFFCQEIQYDTQAVKQEKLSHMIAAHSILGVFMKKEARCEGIAKAAKLLLNTVGVKCIVMEGAVEGPDGELHSHMWNAIKLGDMTYHMDLTLDMERSSKEGMSYDYYMLSEKRMLEDHILIQEMEDAYDVSI